MQRIILPNPSGLPKQKIEELILNFFSNEKISNGKSSQIGFSLYAKKNDAIGVGIKVKAKNDRVFISLVGYTPSVLYRFLFLGIIPYLIIMPKIKDYEKEVFKILNNFDLKTT